MLAAGVPWDAATTMTPDEAEILVQAVAEAKAED
jgi:hypothetical protein